MSRRLPGRRAPRERSAICPFDVGHECLASTSPTEARGAADPGVGPRLGQDCPHQVFVRASGTTRRTRTRASTTTHPPGRPMTGLRSSSATSGTSSASRDSRWTTSTQAQASSTGSGPGSRARAGRPCPPARAPRRRRRSAARSAPAASPRLRQHAARPEGDERAEDRVLDDAGQQLGPAATIGWTSTGAADPRERLAQLARVAQVERDAAALGLVHAGRRRLGHDRVAELGGRGRPPPRSSTSARPPAAAVGLEQRPRLGRARASPSAPATPCSRGRVSTPSSSGTLPAGRRSQSARAAAWPSAAAADSG